MVRTDRMNGRRALVTGGNRGIGLAVVRMLAELGMDVLLGRATWTRARPPWRGSV